MIGSTISHYKILQKLGEGGMGMVYKAEDQNLKRYVAIKFLPALLTRDQETRLRFSQEAQAASALDHPNICTIYEIDQTKDGQLFMVMAFYEGETLETKIKRSLLSFKMLLDYTIQIAHGLATAHKNGIVHRDIKPANIIITADGVVKILDFGLAKLTGQTNLTKEHTSIGTVNYMSPEQAQGDIVDDRTDIWSLGVLLYESTSGRFPFKGEYEQAVIYSIINQDPEPIEKSRKGIPAGLKAVITKSLAKKPSERYQTVIDMLDELKKVREGIETGTKIDLPIEIKKTIKKSTLFIGSLIIVALILIVVVWSWMGISDPSEKRSITVLPFENLSKIDQNEYFSDGITEDITVQLSKISDLRVISYRSSQEYKNSDKNLAQIGKELHVDNILTGKVRRFDNLIRITAQLIIARTGEQKWADAYDRELREIFNIQSEVAKKIAGALEIELSNEEEEIIDKRYTNNLGAYDYYLRGRNYYYRISEADNETAIGLFKKSITYDPNFAPAYAGLADAFVQKTLRFGKDSFWLDSAIVQCNHALNIDPDLAEAHKALGLIYYTRSWFDKSLKENYAALDRNPNFYLAMHNQGWIYLNLGDLVIADKWLEKAYNVDPTFANTCLGIGQLNMVLGEYDTAQKWLTSAHDLHPDLTPNPFIVAVMIEILKNDLTAAKAIVNKMLSNKSNDSGILMAAGDVALLSGNPGKAGEYYKDALEISANAWHPFTGINATTSLGFILQKTDYQSEAEEMLQYSIKMDTETRDQGSQWWGVTYDLAAIYAILGNKEESYRWLEQSIQDGFRSGKWLSVDPLFENINQDQKFQLMVTSLNTDVSKMRRELNQ
jgi:serine/threonine protein kinase